MSQRTVPINPEEWRPRPGAGYAIAVGVVVSQQPGTNRADVRLSGAPARVLRNVLVPKGTTFQADEHVVLVKVASEPGWLALARYEGGDEFGLTISKVNDETDLHPPTNFTVSSGSGLVLGQWDCWPGMSVCWQVQSNERAQEGGALTVYTYGHQHVLLGEPPGMRWMRVRAVRYQPDEDEATYSAWTPWKGAVPGVSGQQVLRNLHQIEYVLDEIWNQHLEGEL